MVAVLFPIFCLHSSVFILMIPLLLSDYIGAFFVFNAVDTHSDYILSPCSIEIDVHKKSLSAGKSMCYQLPPLYLNQVAIVISPLISLMEDRECGLCENLIIYCPPF